MKEFFDKDGKVAFVVPVEVKPGQTVALFNVTLDRLTYWTKIDWSWQAEFVLLRPGTARFYVIQDSENADHLRRIKLDVPMNISERDSIILEFTHGT
jgi:hypothetical protein